MSGATDEIILRSRSSLLTENDVVMAADPRLLDFLSAYDRHICGLALALREILLEEAPESFESIYDLIARCPLGTRLQEGYKTRSATLRHTRTG